MFLFISLNIFIPHDFASYCKGDDNGYTCKDIDQGIKSLNERLKMINKNTTKFVIVKNNAKGDIDVLFSRLFTIIISLITKSTPIFKPYQQLDSIGISSLAYYEKIKDLKVDFNVSVCKKIPKLTKNITKYEITTNPGILMYNPSVFKLLEKLGPASLHILMHLTLNLSTPLNRSQNNYVYGKMDKSIKCETDNNEQIDKFCPISDVMKASSGNNFVHQLPNACSWLINLIRGQSPYLYDNVGKGCWKAKSYMAGGVNPIYPGTNRGINDLTRFNEECIGADAITRRMMKSLL